MVLLLEKKNRDADIKLGMQTQLDLANNMGWFPSGHTFSSLLCVRLKIPKMILLIKHFDLSHVHLSLKKVFFFSMVNRVGSSLVYIYEDAK